jgi:Tfp pilus assembly protein PilO
MRKMVASPREKWLLGAAGVAVLAYLLMQYSILPYWDSLGATSEKIEIQSKRVIQYRRILKGQDSVKAALETVRRQASSIESGLLSSRADALANAEIQGIVKDLAVSKGMTFRRTDLLPVKPVSPEYTKVSTRIEVLGAINQLVDLLASFESGQKILFVEEMRISPLQLGNAKNKQLLATLLVSGLKSTDKNVPDPGRKL